jgi:hypothetical protein
MEHSLKVSFRPEWRNLFNAKKRAHRKQITRFLHSGRNDFQNID